MYQQICQKVIDLHGKQGGQRGYGQKSSEKGGYTQAAYLHESHLPLMYIDQHRIATNLLPLTPPNPTLLSAAVQFADLDSVFALLYPALWEAHF